jgi:hypothetical protein
LVVLALLKRRRNSAQNGENSSTRNSLSSTKILVEVYCKGARLHASVSVLVREKAQPAILFCQQEILVEGMGERETGRWHARPVNHVFTVGWLARATGRCLLGPTGRAYATT